MFELAHKHATDALTAMAPSVTRSTDRTLTDLYPFALYLADNDQFSRRFIDEFPADRPTDMPCVLNILRATSELDVDALEPYKTIGRFALNGDRVAIKKSLMPPNDGAVAEYTTDLNTRIVSKYPHTSLEALQTMTEQQRSRVICFNLDSTFNQTGYDHFLSLKPTSQVEMILLRDLNRLHDVCTTSSRSR